MNDKHPITPPPELVLQWREESSTGELHFSPQYLATKAARWGADQELDACCKWLECNYNYPQANPLRVARRPKPPSLKKQALSLIPEVCGLPMMRTYSPDELLILRRALEAQ